MAADAPTGPLTAEDIEDGISWIEETLVVPYGALRGGEPFLLQDWQKVWIRDVYADGIGEGGLSIARGNGKSSLIASLLISHLYGPWRRQNWHGLVASINSEKAKNLRSLMVGLCKASGISFTMHVSPTPGKFYGDYDSELMFLAADGNAGQAFDPWLVIIDEYGLLGENKREFVHSLYSALGKRPGSRLFGISIQGDGPMFREMQERAAMKAVCWKRFMTPPDADITDREAWLLSNPGLGWSKTGEQMQREVDRAVATPLNEAYFRAHDLNQDLSPAHEMVVGASQWNAICHEDAVLEGEPVVLGIDLGETQSMSAVVAVGVETGTLWAFGAFGDTPDLLQRGRSDGVSTRYLQMHEQGQLGLFSGRVVPLDMFMDDIFAQLRARSCRVLAAAADSYGQGRLRQWWIDRQVEAPLEVRKTWQSVFAHADLQAFQRKVYQKELRTTPGLLMEGAILASTLKRDGKGAASVDRARKRGQNDALVAALLAVGLWDRGQFQLDRGIAVCSYDAERQMVEVL